jgi:hypothetical protein
MKRHVLLRIYPRAWRERYGEELSEQLELLPLTLGVVADVLRGAVDAHRHPLRRNPNMMEGANMSDRRAIASRLAVIWTPMAAVCIGTAMVLIDFWFGHGTYRLVGFSPGLSRSEQLALPKVRYFLYDELYDLTLHLAMLAVALAGALIFMAVARRVTSANRT